MTGTADGFEHLYAPGADDDLVLLMLHGTGGDERQIAGLAPLLDPTAGVLAPRGRISEHGMLRWFRRHGEGVFDFDSVRSEAGELAAFIDAARTRYGIGDRRLVAVGLSNGANIALATALLYPGVLDAVVAFSGMSPLPDEESTGDLTGLDIALLNGANDPMAPAPSVDRLERRLRAGGATVERVTRPGGHGIDRSDVDAARRWLLDRSGSRG